MEFIQDDDPYLEKQITFLIEELLDDEDPNEKHCLFIIDSPESLSSIRFFLSRFGIGPDGIGDLLTLSSIPKKQILAILDESIYIELKRSQIPFFSIRRFTLEIIPEHTRTLAIVIPSILFTANYISSELHQYIIHFLIMKLDLLVNFKILPLVDKHSPLYYIEMSYLNLNQQIYLHFVENVPSKSIVLTQIYLSHISWPVLLDRLEIFWHYDKPNQFLATNYVIDILNEYLLSINQEPLLIL